MHLISYYSSARIAPDDTSQEVGNIVSSSVLNNYSKDITGVLFFHNDYFYQVIEGEERELRNLYATLEKDPRHTDLHKVIDMPVQMRAFDDWNMDVFHIDNPEILNPTTLTLLQKLYFENFNGDAIELTEFVKHMVNEIGTFRIKSRIEKRTTPLN